MSFQKMFTSKNLTCFEFGYAYLMVELDDEYKGMGNKPERMFYNL